MKEKKIIQDWLNGSLNDEEAKTALGAAVFLSYERIIISTQKFKAPEFDYVASKKRIQIRIEAKKNALALKKSKLLKLWTISSISAAAIVIYIFTLLTKTSDTVLIQTGIAEKTTFFLPDSSKVTLNSNAQLSYNSKDWVNNKSVQLQGEAYFNVTKGSTFSVVSTNAITTVLGTRFNVYDREDFMEVYCYHGTVKVVTANSSNTLKSTYVIRLDNKNTYNLKTNYSYPLWIDRFSEFKSVGLKHVLMEIENQFPVTIEVASSIDLSKKFTGKFTHNDLTEALQSFALPLGLSYTLEGNKVFLKKIEK